MPSDAVHGRSNAKRKTLTVATRTADPQMDQGRPKSTAYCAESERPISRLSLRPLHDEPEDALRLPSLHDPVPRLLLERLEVRHRARVGGAVRAAEGAGGGQPPRGRAPPRATPRGRAR